MSDDTVDTLCLIRESVRRFVEKEVMTRAHVWEERGFEVFASIPEVFLKHVQNESDKLGKLMRDNGIKVE